jgi:hypothetical protein
MFVSPMEATMASVAINERLRKTIYQKLARSVFSRSFLFNGKCDSLRSRSHAEMRGIALRAAATVMGAEGRFLGTYQRS